MTHVRPDHSERSLSRRQLLGRAAVATGVATGGVLLGGAMDLAAPRAANAAVAPRIYTCREWNARPPSSSITVLNRWPDHIIVHHTASANTTDYSLSAAFRLAHWIQDLHMDNNGWIDSGQQLTISRGGYLLEGRHRSLYAINNGMHVRGAQCAGHNDHTIGIENEGHYMNSDTTTRLFDKLVATCAWICDVYRLDPYRAIVGHRDYVATLCPGDVLYARLPELRRRVAQALGA